MQTRPPSELVVDALQMAIARRRPKPGLGQPIRPAAHDPQDEQGNPSRRD